MLSKNAKYIISSTFVKIFFGKEQFTFKEKDNIENVSKLIKTEVLKTLVDTINNESDKTIFDTIKNETNLKRMVKLLRRTCLVNEELFKTFINVLALTNRKKPREQVLILLAKYIKNNEHDLECNIIEDYIRVLYQNELLLNNFIDSDTVDDDDLEEVENEEVPAGKKSRSKKLVKKHTIKMTKDKVTIDGEDLKTDEKLVRSHIIRSIKSGVSKTVYHKFLSKIKNNPKKYIEDELFKFLENGRFPIADDGDFYAFKKVDYNYKDNYTHKIDNRPGKIVTMDRKQVCGNRDITCSSGLHFASLEYAKNYIGTKLMILKVNPEDVVSIPNDDNNQKGRCCRYKVICEISDISCLDISTKEFLKKIKNIEIRNDKILKNNVNPGEEDFIKF